MKKIVFLIVITLLVIQLSFVNNISYADMPIGNYIELLGGYIKATSSLDSFPEAFSLEIWVRPDSISGIQKIVSIGDKDTNSLHSEVGINGSSLSFRFRYGVGSLKLITAGNIVADTWNHIAVSITSAYTKLFINGEEVISTSGATNLLPIGNNIVVGRSYLEQSFEANAYKGDLDELRISTTSRNISSLWSAGNYDNPLSEDADTFLLWHFDEARGETQAFDNSSSKLHGVLIGGDKQIHFFGIPPTPTPFALPTIYWQRPVFPTLPYPDRFRQIPRTVTPTPNIEEDNKLLTPSPSDVRQRVRSDRPILSR